MPTTSVSHDCSLLKGTVSPESRMAVYIYIYIGRDSCQYLNAPGTKHQIQRHKQFWNLEFETLNLGLSFFPYTFTFSTSASATCPLRREASNNASSSSTQPFIKALNISSTSRNSSKISILPLGKWLFPSCEYTLPTGKVCLPKGRLSHYYGKNGLSRGQKEFGQGQQVFARNEATIRTRAKVICPSGDGICPRAKPIFTRGKGVLPSGKIYLPTTDDNCLKRNSYVLSPITKINY